MGVSKTSEHIQIIIKIKNQSQEHPASSKAPNQDLKDMNVLCTLQIKIKSQNSEYGCIKDHWPYPSLDPDENPSQEPPVASETPSYDLKDTYFFFTCKIEIKSITYDHQKITYIPSKS